MKLMKELITVVEADEESSSAATEAQDILDRFEGGKGDDLKDFDDLIAALKAAGFKKKKHINLGYIWEKDGVEVQAALDDNDLTDWQAFIKKGKPAPKTDDEPIEEATSASQNANVAKHARFKRIINTLQDDLEHFDSFLKEDSQFQRLVKELGGDVAVIKSARGHHQKLFDDLQDLEVSVGMAQEPFEDEDAPKKDDEHGKD
jgi:hypothetical protein